MTPRRRAGGPGAPAGRTRRGWRAPAALVALSVLVNFRGASSPAVYRWNVDPVDVDQRPERLWDWRDPQFLRGL